jgi:hypothetical protein
MIDKPIIVNFEHLAVHVEPIPFTPFENRMNRIKGRTASGCVPFAFVEPGIIIRIDDGVLTLGQRYPAEGVPVAQAPV